MLRFRVDNHLAQFSWEHPPNPQGEGFSILNPRIGSVNFELLSTP
jgi:hypothetical protein